MASKKKSNNIMDHDEEISEEAFEESFQETSPNGEVKTEIETLKRAADALQVEIEEAVEKAREMETLFAAIREKRQRLRTINKVLFALTGERGEIRPRRPNGANRTTINNFLHKHPKSSVKAISEATGISIPSVRATLKGGGFAQDESHRWTVD